MGQQIGKYELIRKLATGGMAEVFLAKAAGPMGFEKTLVLKRILPHLAEDQSFVDMFLAEARLAAQLNHPNVVQIFDFGEVDGTYFLAMEYVDGPNLRALNKRASKLSTPLDPPIVAKVISFACEGLAYAHEFCDQASGQHMELIHRDVSPDNILLSRTGAVKVVDFGIAKAANKEATRTGVRKGKLAYMSPEQVRAKGLDLRADVYSLGTVLYELLSGARPYESESDVGLMNAIMNEPMTPLLQRRPDAPAPLVQVVERALQRRAEDRYQTCREMQADLERYLLTTGQPVGGYQLAQLVLSLASEGFLSADNQRSPKPFVTPSHSSTAYGTPPRAGTPRPTGPKPTGTPRVSGSRRPPPEAPKPPEPDDSADEAPSPGRRGVALALAVPALIIGIVGGALAFGRSGSLKALPARAAPLSSPAPTPTPTPEPVPAPVPPPPLPKPDPPRAEAQAPPKVEKKAPKAKVVAAADPDLTRLVVESVPPGHVRVNGRAYGKSPATVKNLPPGDVKIEVFDPAGAFSRTEVYTLARGDSGTKTVVVAKGRVEFRVRPYATVFFDGKPLGQTPLPAIEAYEGTHQVKLANKDLNKEVTVPVVVKPGQASVVKYVFGEDEER